MNYYIQGDTAKAEQIKAAFEELGCDTGNLGFTSSQLYYTIEGRVELMCTKSLQNLIKTHPDYKELPLPKPHYDIANFKAGMPVLVRCTNSECWKYGIYSHYGKYEAFSTEDYFICVGSQYIQCIPYNDDTKHLLGTNDMPSEEYINW